MTQGSLLTTAGAAKQHSDRLRILTMLWLAPSVARRFCRILANSDLTSVYTDFCHVASGGTDTKAMHFSKTAHR
ncbi:unnamed protein product [Caretta caretta]